MSLVDLARSARAAVAGVAAAPAWSQAPRPVAADDLLPERVLVGDPSARTRLIDVAFTPIAEAGDALVDTVGTFLDCGHSLEATARTMFVHPNTVRYRLKKVAQLTGWDALETRDAYVLATAFALGRLGEAPHINL